LCGAFESHLYFRIGFCRISRLILWTKLRRAGDSDWLGAGGRLMTSSAGYFRWRLERGCVEAGQDAASKKRGDCGARTWPGERAGAGLRAALQRSAGDGNIAELKEALDACRSMMHERRAGNFAAAAELHMVRFRSWRLTAGVAAEQDARCARLRLGGYGCGEEAVANAEECGREESRRLCRSGRGFRARCSKARCQKLCRWRTSACSEWLVQERRLVVCANAIRRSLRTERSEAADWLVYFWGRRAWTDGDCEGAGGVSV